MGSAQVQEQRRRVRAWVTTRPGAVWVKQQAWEPAVFAVSRQQEDLAEEEALEVLGAEALPVRFAKALAVVETEEAPVRPEAGTAPASFL